MVFEKSLDLHLGARISLVCVNLLSYRLAIVCTDRRPSEIRWTIVYSANGSDILYAYATISGHHLRLRQVWIEIDARACRHHPIAHYGCSIFRLRVARKRFRTFTDHRLIKCLTRRTIRWYWPMVPSASSLTIINGGADSGVLHHRSRRINAQGIPPALNDPRLWSIYQCI